MDPLSDFRLSLDQYRGSCLSWFEVMRLPLKPKEWAQNFGLSRMTMWRVMQEPEKYYVLVGKDGSLTLLKVMAED